MSEFNLDTYLATMQAEGTSQGEGSFTISHQKAAEKRAKFSLVRDHSWVLKLVQAAVGWGCTNLSIKQSRTTSIFHFRFDDYSAMPNCQNLVHSILLADFENDQPEHCLASALRVIVERSHLSFLLGIDRDSGEAEALYAGFFYGDLEERARKKLRQNWQPGLTLAIHHIEHTKLTRHLLNIVPIRHHGLPVLHELDHYAYACPIPIKLDGRRIDGIFRTPALEWSFSKRPLAVTGLKLDRKLSPTLEICSDVFARTFTVHSPRPSGEVNTDQAPNFPAYLCLSAEVKAAAIALPLEKRAQLHWVRDGIIVQKETLNSATHHLHLDLFANAEGLSTDLTGFKLRATSDYRVRRKAVLEGAAEYLQAEFKKDRDPCAKEPSLEPSNQEFSEVKKKGLLAILARRVQESASTPLIGRGVRSLSDSYKKEVGELWASLSAKRREELNLEEFRLQRLAVERQSLATAKEHGERELLRKAQLEKFDKEQRLRKELAPEATRKEAMRAEAERQALEKDAKTQKRLEEARARNYMQNVDPQWLEQLRRKSQEKQARKAAEKAGLPLPSASAPETIDSRKYL